MWLFISLAVGVFLGVWSFLLLALAYFRAYRPYVLVAIFGALVNIYVHSHKVKVPNGNRYAITCKIGEKLKTDIYEVDVLECASINDPTKYYDNFQSVLEFYEPSEKFIKYNDVVKIEVFSEAITKTERYKSIANSLLQNGYSQKLIAYPNKDFKIYRNKTSENFIQGLRSEVNRRLAKLSWQSNNYSILQKIITGESNATSKKEVYVFRDAGLAHILAVSGLHIGILYVVLSCLLCFMNFSYKLKLVKIALIAVILFLYVWFVNFQPSAIRAVFMITLLSYGALRASNKMMKYNILFGTAFIMLLYDTAILYDLSFQLSFTAVAGIMYGISQYTKYVYIKNRVLNYILLSAVVTLSAQIATLPLVLYYFGTFSTVSLFSNIIIAPLITPLLIITVVYVVSNAGFIGDIACYVIDFIMEIAEWFTKLPYSNFREIDFRFEDLVVTYIAYFLIFINIELTNKEKSLSLRKQKHKFD